MPMALLVRSADSAVGLGLEVSWNMTLSGKNAIVTGASRKAGIGAGIAKALSRAGAGVLIIYYRPYDAMQP